MDRSKQEVSTLKSDGRGRSDSADTLQPISITRRHESLRRIAQLHGEEETFICSPISMYKLAIRLDDAKMKADALAQIESGLTLENIAFEFFGAFSLAHTEVQEAQLVLKSTGW